MKKISALLIAAFVLFGVLVFPASAADNANYPVEFPLEGKTPKCDGVIDRREYGEILPIHSTSVDQSQFNYDHDEYKNWNIDFYACWSGDGIYLAWNVMSEQHAPLPKAEFGTDGKPIGENFTDESLGYMWMYSSVTVIITPGNPTKGDYSDNYLKLGICELEDHSTARIVWERPDDVSDADIAIDNWDAKVVRDDKNGTTTYELFVPWEMSGFLYPDLYFDGFGLSYAVASQEHYGDKQGIIEWQGGAIHDANPNNAGVITLEPIRWIPGPAPDPEPDDTSDTVSDTTSDTTPDTTSDATSDTVSDTSDAIFDTTSDSVSDIISDTPSDSSVPPAVNSSDADKAIIGGADGPTAILVAKTVAPWLFVAVLVIGAVAAVVVVIIKKKKTK